MLACNLLLFSFRSTSDSWPIQFVKLFIEDFTQERIWSDLSSQLTKDFVLNIIRAFKTEIPAGFYETLNSSIQRQKLHVSSSTSSATLKEDSKPSPRVSPIPFMSMQSKSTEHTDRYPGDSAKSLLCKLVTDVGNDIIARTKLGGSSGTAITTQSDSLLRNLLQLLTITCGLTPIRMYACTKLDAWLHNTKLIRPAQDLLSSVCINSATEEALSNSSENEEIIANLIRIKPKNKMVGNLVMTFLKEMALSSPAMGKVFVRNIIFNEFSGSSRNSNNMALLSQLLQSNGLEMTAHLAHAFQLALYQKEDYTKAVRTFFREIVKCQRNEIKFDHFATQILDIQPEVKKKMENENLPLFKYLSSVADVASYAMYICLPMNCRDLYSSRLKRDEKDFSILVETQSVVAQVLSHFAEWVKVHAPYITPEQFTPLMQKMLIFEPVESYTRQDSYPPDALVCHRILTESGVLESCLFNLIAMAMDPAIPLNASAAMNFIEGLITRSPLNVIIVSRGEEFIEELLKLAMYCKPASISLPVNYQEPKLAVSSLLWKAWSILLILSGSNVETVAKLGWQKYPMLKMLMEMTLTSDFNFPPSASELDREELRRNEVRVAEHEKNEIITFECHLAGKMMTAQTSLLISQLMYMDPLGTPRQPSAEYLSHLKHVCNSLKVGNALCSSRNNDYLLDILKRNRTICGSGSTWLSQIILTSDITSLPPQCLCEFLLIESSSNASVDYLPMEKRGKLDAITCHLSDSLVEAVIEGSDTEYAAKVLIYLLSALTSSEDINKKHVASSVLINLMNKAFDETVKTENLFEKLAKIEFLRGSLGRDLIEFALQVFAKDFDLQLVASALKYIISRIATQNVENRSYLIQFSRSLTLRNLTVSLCLKYCSEVRTLFSSVSRIIFTNFRPGEHTEELEKGHDHDWFMITVGRGTKFYAPSVVVTSLYILLTLSEEADSSLETFPLAGLHFNVAKKILPEWVMIQLSCLYPKLFSKWVEQMEDLEDLMQVLTYPGVGSHILKLVFEKIEKFSLGEIKACSKDRIPLIPLNVVPDFGPKLECAYTSIRPGISSTRTTTRCAVIEEIDELDVDVLDDGEAIEDPLKIEDCKTDSDWAMLITQIVTKHHGQTLTLVSIATRCTDYEDLSDAMSSVCEVPDIVASFVENIRIHDFTSFLLNLAKNLSFRRLSKLCNNVKRTFTSTKFRRSVKILENHLQLEEQKMQPKSPEPESKLSLESKSLLEYAKPKIGSLSGQQFSNTGKVLDLVQISDPEIVRSHPDYLWNVLFSAKHSHSAYHCFMLASLIHDVSWKTLLRSLDKLLNILDKPDVVLNPTIVFDFLTALQMHPKFFQGRDTSLLNKLSNDILTFDISVLSKLLILLYQESSENLKFEKSYLDQLQSRVGLLLSLMSKQSFTQDVNSLISLCDTFKNERICKSIQMLFYLNTAVALPELKSKLSSIKTDKFQNSFPTDNLCYDLVMPLNSCAKMNIDTVSLVTSLILNFSSTHPVFASRHLDLLAVLFKGKLRTSWGSFKKEGHADFFRVCVRVLLRLAPDVFSHKRFPEIITSILDALKGFASLTNELYRNIRTELFQLVDKFFEADHSLAKKVLAPYASFLADTPKRNKYLLNSIGALDSDTKNYSQISNQNVTCWELMRCRKFFNGCLTLESSCEDVLAHLKIVEDLSHKKECGVETVLEPIMQLLQSSNSEVVERSLTVCLGFVKQNPALSDELADALIQLFLNGKNVHNIEKLLNVYSIDVLLANCSNKGVRLLEVIFDACIFTFNPNTTGQMKKVVSSKTLENIFQQMNL